MNKYILILIKEHIGDKIRQHKSYVQTEFNEEIVQINRFTLEMKIIKFNNILWKTYLRKVLR